SLLAGIQLHSCKAHEPLGRLLRGSGQPGVYLSNFSALTRTGVCNCERDLGLFAWRHLQTGIAIGCVGKPEPKREERLLVLRVIPLVADLHALVIGHRKWRQSCSPLLRSSRSVEMRGCGWRHGDRGMRQIRFALRECVGEFAARVYRPE